MNIMHKFCLGAFLLLLPLSSMAQGPNSIKINEVVVLNDSDGIVDETGARCAWIELANTSWSKVNVRNCFLTNNRAALDPTLSAPQRIALMCLLKKGDTDTELAPKGFILYFADGKTNKGVRHLNFTFSKEDENFLALYDGNGVTLLDSVTIPKDLKKGCSYARQADEKGISLGWKMMAQQDVTPGNANKGAKEPVNKIQEWKEKDPYGIIMTVLAMGIVFSCLLILYLFFRLFGIFAKKTFGDAAPSMVLPAQEKETESIKPNEMNKIVTVIAMAIHESQNTHDKESDRITIVSHPTDWNRKTF